MRSAPLLYLSLVLAACSHRALSTTDGGETVATHTDRLRIKGTFCPGVEPGEVRRPVKLLFVVDTSNSMSANDPLDHLTGKTRRRAAIEDVVKRFETNDVVSYAIVSFNHKKEVLTKTPAGLDGFTRDPKALKTALAKLDAADGLTDLEGAVSSAFQVLGADMSRMRQDDPHALQLSTYIVLLLADGGPNPQIHFAADWATIPNPIQKDLVGTSPPPKQYNVPAKIFHRVKNMMELSSLYNAASLRLHTFYLEGTNTAPSPAPLLKSIAKLGNGIFRSFPNQEDIDFLAVNYSSQGSGGLDLKTLVVANQNLRPTVSGPALDSDGDGLTDALERKLGTSVHTPDTDGDGWSDALEHKLKQDPLNPKDADCAHFPGGGLDSDGDGLLDCEERFLGTHRKLPDSDADGFDDRLEVLGGTSPTSPENGGDLDNDGVKNGDELLRHSSPTADEGAAGEAHAYRYSVKQVFAQPCYSFEVDNIKLAGPPLGVNTIVLHAAQLLSKDPRDFGVFRAACVRASPGPAPLEVEVPQRAWKRLGALDPTADCLAP